MTTFFFILLSLIVILALFIYAIECFINLDLSTNHITFIMVLVGFVSSMLILLNIQLIRNERTIDKLEDKIIRCEVKK